MTIVAAAVGKQCRPGQPTSRLLDILEATQQAGYELLLGTHPNPAVHDGQAGIALALSAPALLRVPLY